MNSISSFVVDSSLISGFDGSSTNRLAGKCLLHADSRSICDVCVNMFYCVVSSRVVSCRVVCRGELGARRCEPALAVASQDQCATELAQVSDGLVRVPESTAARERRGDSRQRLLPEERQRAHARRHNLRILLQHNLAMECGKCGHAGEKE